MPAKPTLSINTTGSRTIQRLMIRVQDRAREIKHLQDNILPKLKQQLSDAAWLFKCKEQKAFTAQIEQTEKEISEKPDILPEISRMAVIPTPAPL